MLPAFAVMLLLAALHAAYGALPFMRDAFYGIGPVVLGIFAAAVWRLGANAIKDRFSVLVALGAIAALLLSPLGPAGVFLLAGCIGVAVHHSRKGGLVAALVVLILVGAERFAESILPALSAGEARSAGLWDLGVFFFKVGAVTFGGGLTIIAFIQEQVVNQLQWISAEQFLDALAIGQVTPGPVIMLAAFVGYKVAGIAGAAAAAAAIFLPSFLLMLSILPMLDRVRTLAWTKAAMRGIGPAVVGAVALAVVQLTPHAVPDLFTGALFVLTIVGMLAWRLRALPLAAGGGLLGIAARLPFVMRLREFT
jgi:chromate transporter